MSVGELLAHARVPTGLPLQDLTVVSRPRICAELSIDNIDAMEHDDFRHCGGALYARRLTAQLPPATATHAHGSMTRARRGAL
jgi:hypothetical protein